MTNSDWRFKPAIILALIMGVIFSVTVQAAAKYKFVVNGGTASSQHTPFLAEMELSDSAVTSGQADAGDVESLIISAGNFVPANDPVVFSHLHSHFINLAAVLSIDRETITSFSAQSSENMQLFDFWLFYQQVLDPPVPNVHDTEVLVRADSVTIRTLLSPDFNYVISEFTGEWRRQHEGNDCRFCIIFDHYVVDCFPWCPWPWVIILSSIIIVAITARLVTKRYSKRNR